MADLTSAQKAALIVETSEGGWTDPAQRVYTLSEGAPFHIEPVGNDHAFVVADAPGSGTILVSCGGESGSIEVSVTAAPLIVTLGTPVAK
jgi:hypothetical protein